jgi:hypothetical protein
MLAYDIFHEVGGGQARPVRVVIAAATALC